MVLETVIFVLPIGIIVIKVGDVFSLTLIQTFFHINTKLKMKCFGLLSFKFLLTIPFSLTRRSFRINEATI